MNCSACCKNFPYIQLAPADVAAIAAHTGLAPDAFTHHGEHGDEKCFMQFKENGDCTFLSTIDGNNACRIYEARTTICRAYPSTTIQHRTCRHNSHR